jgi:hypothetical protein
MKHLTIRFVVALVTFILGITMASVWLIYPSKKAENAPSSNMPSSSQDNTRSEEILRVLLPNGTWGDARQLDRFDHSETIKALSEAQVEAKGARAISIAYLLAVLGHGYEANRKRLLDAMNECAHKPYPEDSACDFFIADYMMELGRRGDITLFQPLFDVTHNADGAFAQALGGFYSDMLREKPELFIKALASRSKKEQRDFCWAAGMEDGSGMSEERARDVREILKRISANSSAPYSPVAKNCLLGVEAAYKSAKEN